MTLQLLFVILQKKIKAPIKNYIIQLQTEMTSSVLGCNSEDFNSCVQEHNSLSQHVSSNNMQYQQINNLNDQSLQDNLSMLSSLLDRNNKLYIQLIDMYEKLQVLLEMLMKTCTEKKESIQKTKSILQKKDQVRKRKLDQTLDKNSFNLELKLFGCKQQKYELVLLKSFEKELYKDRNFELSVKLIDLQKNIVPNQNLIPVTLSAYTSDDNPVPIFQNKSGQSIFKGNCERELYNGIVEFTKLQFREVSSIYSKKWVYFVIYAKTPSFNYTSNSNLPNGTISHQQIRPLIISEVVIKSKKK